MGTGLEKKGKARKGKKDIIDRGRRDNRMSSENSKMQSLESKMLKLHIIECLLASYFYL